MNNTHHLYEDIDEEDTPIQEERDDFASHLLPLQEQLDDLRKIEGFPLGKDEDILALSDPPYYTACPNPYLNAFIDKYGTPYNEDSDDYRASPFVGDVSEGKNDPIYNAHSYHTKVPHKAIMHYILHYTKPGDIIFDGFCGTGMTGVAAQFCGDKATVESLGYKVNEKSEIYDKEGNYVTKLGARRAILNDLSPAATFIAYNYNTPINAKEFEKEAKRILTEVENECGWMYETLHTDGKSIGKINYTVWSDVFICPYCSQEFIFWDAAVDKENGKVLDKFPCPNCHAEIKKTDCKRANHTFFDESIQEEITQSKQVPVMINYSVGTKRFEKSPDEADLELIKKIDKTPIPYWFPANIIIKGDKTREFELKGITHVHHIYTKRNLWILSVYFQMINKKLLLFLFTSAIINLAKTCRYRFNKSGPMSGTWYVSSMTSELNVIKMFTSKLKQIAFPSFQKRKSNALMSINSSKSLSLQCNNIDYIFTDPPFGDNLMYSELSFIWESWLKVWTNNKSEAIINKTQKKDLDTYKKLMIDCFRENYRILKPNRWMTVEFHNSKASVWNAIQDSITKAGFIVAQVAVLNKEQGSFNQVTASGAVKNDLVINAYKPKQSFEEAFLKQAGKNLEKVFVAEHLSMLPVEQNIERTEQMLYSKMLAHYLSRGFEIKLNSHQFYKMLRDHFKLIDGYWFTDEQVLAYDDWKKAISLDKIKGLRKGQQTLFIYDEKSAILWLYHYLEDAKNYSDIYLNFQKAVTSIEDQLPELRHILDQNFIFENDHYRRPFNEKEKDTIALKKERELEKVFNQLLEEASQSNKRIKEVRKEALLFGFTKAYQEKRFEDILRLANKLYPSILEENSELNDFVSIAKLKTEEGIFDKSPG